MDSDYLQELPRPLYERDAALVTLYDEAWTFLLRSLPELSDERFVLAAAKRDGAAAAARLATVCFAGHACKWAPASIPDVARFRDFHLRLCPDARFESLPPALLREPGLPMFAWNEYENVLLTGDVERIRSVLRHGHLQALYERSEALETVSKAAGAMSAAARRVRGYHAQESAFGADDPGRGLGRAPDESFSVDMLARQCLAALCVSRLAALVCDTNQSSKWRGKYAGKKTLLRRWYWDSALSFYLDLDCATMRRIQDPTPAGFWPIVCGCPDLVEIESLAERLADPAFFGGPHPFPSLPRDSARYDAADPALRMRPEDAFLALSGLSRYGQLDALRPLALACIERVRRVRDAGGPHGFRTAYAANADGPHPKAASDERAAVATLLPINLFLECVIGVHYVDAFRRLICWNPSRDAGRTGVRNLRFGDNRVDLLCDGKCCQIRADGPFLLHLAGARYDVPAGLTSLPLPPATTRGI